MRRSWTRWHLSRTKRRLGKAERRLLLLQLETDHQLLVTKELRQRMQQLVHRQREMADSQQYHLLRQAAQVETQPLPPDNPERHLQLVPKPLYLQNLPPEASSPPTGPPTQLTLLPPSDS